MPQPTTNCLFSLIGEKFTKMNRLWQPSLIPMHHQLFLFIPFVPYNQEQEVHRVFH